MHSLLNFAHLYEIGEPPVKQFFAHCYNTHKNSKLNLLLLLSVGQILKSYKLFLLQKQPPIGVPRKRCSENM